MQLSCDLTVKFLACKMHSYLLNYLCLKQKIKVSALTIEDGAQAVRFPHARIASEL